MKTKLSVLLVLILLFGCMTSAHAEQEGTTVNSEISSQISLIHDHINDLFQPDIGTVWYYSIMDFDHNGRLEFFAATQHPADRSTSLKVWEVTEDLASLTECTIVKDPDESFPDILSNSADAFHDVSTGTWSYLFYDNIILSPADVYTVMCSVSLKDGALGYESYAVEHSEMVNSYRYVTHLDNNGFPISDKQYNSMAINAFAGAERSAVNFDWFQAGTTVTLSRLINSYEVFTGSVAPAEDSPVFDPPILHHDELAPVYGSAGDLNATYMVITRNPGSVKIKSNASIKFVADANVYDSAYWTFVSPDGGEYDLAYFQAHFIYSSISGAYDTTLHINAVDGYMDGWGAYCTFSFKGQTAVTSTAWINITDNR